MEGGPTHGGAARVHGAPSLRRAQPPSAARSRFLFLCCLVWVDRETSWSSLLSEVPSDRLQAHGCARRGGAQWSNHRPPQLSTEGPVTWQRGPRATQPVLVILDKERQLPRRFPSNTHSDSTRWPIEQSARLQLMGAQWEYYSDFIIHHRWKSRGLED